MKRGLWAGFWAIFVLALGAACFVMLMPKIGHASRAEIEAVLPASLKIQDPSDPAGLDRYDQVAAIVSSLNYRDVEQGLGSSLKPGDPAAVQRALATGKEPMVEVGKILDQGDLRYPERKVNTLFRDSPNLKSFSKLIGLATKDAVERGDRAAALRYAVLGLRYGAALRKGGGVLIDSLVATASEAISAKAVYDTEMSNGFDAKGREAMLAQLPVETGTMPELGASIRRDFQAMFMPILLDPQGQIEALNVQVSGDNPNGGKPKSIPGTFDPVETAKLVGEIYDATIRDSALPLDQQTKVSQRIADEARKGVPNEHEGPEFLYRIKMNMGRNTIGRTLATNGVFDQLANVARRRATERNLVRAVILLRMGQSPDLPDPYGKGKLKIDRKRRIVWSVGQDGKDDGGDIIGGASKAKDQGHGW